MSSSHLKAVIFDVGGVVVKSPLLAIAAYEREQGLPKDFINVCIAARGDQGAWQRFERGELPLLRFYREFTQDLNDLENASRWYREHCARRNVDCPPIPTALSIDGRELFGRMMRESSEFNSDVVEAIRHIRRQGKYRLIALTNDYSRELSLLRGPGDSDADLLREMEFLGWTDGPESDPGKVGGKQDKLRVLFDDFVRSSESGMRKPESAFYLYACNRNGIRPYEAVFLDDIGANLRAAKELGMETIQVRIGRTKEALRELGNKLSLELVFGSRL